MHSSLSQVFNRQVALTNSSSLEKPSYEEYWPDIDGLAQRQKVTDEAMPSKPFLDIAAIYILTTSTINRLRELYPEGEDIVLNITSPCTRCLMITLPQGDLPQDLGILRTVARLVGHRRAWHRR